MNGKNDTHLQTDCDALLALIPEYAFGLTAPEETRLVESGLSACPEAAAQLEGYRRLQSDMREQVPQMNPPAGLEARLMSAIAEPVPVVQPVPMPRRRLRPVWLIAAAAVLLLGLSNLYWLTRVNSLSEEHRQLLNQVSALSPEASAFVLSSTSNLRWVRLPPKEPETRSWALLMWNAENKIGLMCAWNMPELEAGKTYQLWLTRGEVKVSAGTFQLDENGNGTLLFNLTEPIDEFTWARITAEPESGSPQPGENIVVVGEL